MAFVSRSVTLATHSGKSDGQSAPVAQGVEVLETSPLQTVVPLTLVLQTRHPSAHAAAHVRHVPARQAGVSTSISLQMPQARVLPHPSATGPHATPRLAQVFGTQVHVPARQTPPVQAAPSGAVTHFLRFLVFWQIWQMPQPPLHRFLRRFLLSVE